MHRLPFLGLRPALAGFALAPMLAAQHLPPPIEAGSERAFVEERLAELEACEDSERAQALVRLAFTAADAVAFRAEYEQAEELFEQVLLAATDHLDDRTPIGELWCHATRIPMWREEFPVAEEGLRAGLEDLQPGTLYSSIAHNALAICLDRQDREEEALEMAVLAVRDLAEIRFEHVEAYAVACNTHAVVLANLGRKTESLAVREALREFLAEHRGRGRGLTSAVEVSQHEGYARLCHFAGRLEESDTHYERAIELASSQPAPIAVGLRERYGKLLLVRGENERALEVLERGAELYERWRADHDRSELLPFEQSPWRALARARAAAGDADGAFAALDRHHGRLVLDRRLPASEPLPTLEEVRASLGPTEALIGWIYTNDDPGLAWVMRHEGEVQWFDQPEAPDPRMRTCAKFARAVGALEAGPLEALDPADVERAARDYYRAIFAVMEPALDGVDSLLIVSSQGTDRTPLQAAVDDEGRWLGDRFAMTIVPSGGVHAWLRRSPPSGSPPASAVLVGDPPFRPRHLETMATEGPSVELASLAEAPGLRRASSSAAHHLLPRLIGTRREVLTLAERLGSPRLLLGAEATAEAVREAAASADLLHLATHARFESGAATRSALFLACDPAGAPSRVALTEIGRHWELDAELVTLSACSTGREWQTTGGVELGFTQAFLAAGARSVLASAWAVDDEVTRLTMDAFYEAWLGEGLSRARAAQAAARAVREFTDESGARPYAHPYYWAAFSLFGDAR